MAAIEVPAGARFTCQGCGRCCQGWSVGVDGATVERLRAHSWGGDPFESTGNDRLPFRIRLVDGRCYFLDPENRCRIHTEIGYEAKPPVCRAFPLGVFEIGGTRYARLSFWCPTVAANTGRPLDQQTRWLKETTALADRRIVPVTLDGSRELSSDQFQRIHQALRRCLQSSDQPVRDRLAAGAALIRRIERAAKDSVDLLSAVARAESEGVAALAREGLRGGHRSGRRVLTLYLLQDRSARRWSVLTRLASLLLFNAGLGRLHSRAMDCSASRRALERVTFSPNHASSELLARYFCSKLDSRRYVMGEASLTAGFNLLVAAQALIELLARLRAASQGRPQCDEDDIRLAVSAADLLAVEHTGVGEVGLQRRLAEAELASSDLVGALLGGRTR